MKIAMLIALAALLLAATVFGRHWEVDRQ